MPDTAFSSSTVSRPFVVACGQQVALFTESKGRAENFLHWPSTVTPLPSQDLRTQFFSLGPKLNKVLQIPDVGTVVCS